MSQLAIWIGRSFIELSRKTGSEAINKRVSYSINSLGNQLKAALSGFAQDTDKAYLEWQMPYITVERQLGGSTALLTTSGTEAWLELNLPLTPTYLSTQLKRTPMPLTRDLCFGVSERTSATGQVLRSPEKADLEFLVEKLRLNEITHVAVGFLHSAVNPTNELKVVEHFREQGFFVTASHEWKEHSEERPRTWAAVLEGYVDSFLSEKLIEVEQALTSVGILAENIYLREQPLTYFKGPERRWFKSLPFLQFSKPTVYCGAAELLWCVPGQAPAWLAPFGLTALPSVGAERISPSPLQLVSRNFWNGLAWADEAVDWDLGPMCFGKSLKPTLLDVFQSTGKLQPSPGLAERLNDKNAKKIVDALRAHCREGGNRDEQDVLDGLLRTIAENWRLQMPHAGAIHLQGPLAPTVFNIFKHVGLHSGMILNPDEFYISQNILQAVSK